MNSQSEKSLRNASGDVPLYDLLIIGAGINGAGIARDAAGRGYSVYICDSGDFGAATSASSTKLIHGGLRYLEYHKFRLVREALKEREILWQAAPHIIWPLRFVLPHHQGLRPYWLLRLGLFIYDHLGGRRLLPATRSINLNLDQTGIPLKHTFHRGLEYSDCWVEDSRMVILNLRDAQARGATVTARTEVRHAVRKGNHWQVTLMANTHEHHVCAKMVINASGPWVDKVMQHVFNCHHARHIRLVRGSHLIIRKKFNHDKCYIFQNSDDRITFAIPYEKDYTLIGTTEIEHEDINTLAQATSEEIEYLCNMANEYFSEKITVDDVIWNYSGVRPLYDDGATKAQEATRDYVISDASKLIGENGKWLINIFGGKITTYRKLAEQCLDKVGITLGRKEENWTKNSSLPGGDFAVDGFNILVQQLQKKHPYIGKATAFRLARLYGTEAFVLLINVSNVHELGKHFGHGLYAREVEYLIQHEWAACAEDILFRRTKLGLRTTDEQKQQLQEWTNAYINSQNV